MICNWLNDKCIDKFVYFILKFVVCYIVVIEVKYFFVCLIVNIGTLSSNLIGLLLEVLLSTGLC